MGPLKVWLYDGRKQSLERERLSIGLVEKTVAAKLKPNILQFALLPAIIYKTRTVDVDSCSCGKRASSRGRKPGFR